LAKIIHEFFEGKVRGDLNLERFEVRDFAVIDGSEEVVVEGNEGEQFKMDFNFTETVGQNPNGSFDFYASEFLLEKFPASLSDEFIVPFDGGSGNDLNVAEVGVLRVFDEFIVIHCDVFVEFRKVDFAEVHREGLFVQSNIVERDMMFPE
jgi:hypothetical protein